MISKTIKIEKMIHSGLGLARQESGPVILVRRVLPGEVVIVEIIERKKHFLLAQPKTIIQAHAERIDPPCPYYNQCGGCDFQHGSYTLQLQIKRDILIDLARRTLPTSSQGIDDLTRDPLSSPCTSHYRQRIRLQVDKDGWPGFNRYRSHDIISIHHCLLAENALNTTLKEIIDSPTAHTLMTHCREFELLLNPDAGTVIALLHSKRKLRPTDKTTAVQLTSDIPNLEAVFFQGRDFPLTGPFTTHTNQDSGKVLHASLAASSFLKMPLTFTWEVGGFSQVNLRQNRRLIDLVLQYCAAGKNDRVLDLFCGMGNFSIPLALCCDSLLGVEAQRSAIRAAQNNGRAAGLENCTFIQSHVDGLCHQLISDKERFDIVVLDPPRQGIPKLAETIAQLATKKIVYISCDPATLCRDLAQLTQSGFSIQTIKPVDMFPQTHHIETVVLLEKN